MIVNEKHRRCYKAVKHLSSRYKKLHSRSPDHLKIYSDRKRIPESYPGGRYHEPYPYVAKDILTKEAGMAAATELLQSQDPPDAFFTISDYSALGVLTAAQALGLSVPKQLGIVGFSNENFTDIITPTLSSVDQNSRLLEQAAKFILTCSIIPRTKQVSKIKRTCFQYVR